MIQQGRLIQTFMELVRIDSPSGEEEGVAQEVSWRLEALGFTVRRDAHGNVIARHGGDGPARLLLSAHMDTVEPGRGIRPRIEGDRIVSDGTTILGGDCKAGVAAILEGLASFKEEGAGDLSVEVVLTRQEEVGLVGARNLDYSLVTAREAVVFDTGGPVKRIVSGAPTYISFDVDVTGRAAHAGAEPEKGLSAIRVAADLIARLPQGRIDDETTINVGLIRGGSVRNAVPERATLQGEFRSRNLQTLERMRLQVEQGVADLRARYSKAVIELTFTREFDGYNLTGEEPLVSRVRRALQAIGLEPELVPSGGGTDANIVRQHGIFAVVVGMGTRDAHTVREAVEIPWLVDAARFCDTLLRLE